MAVSNRSQRRLANMQMLMQALSMAGQGAGRYKQQQGQEAQQELLAGREKRAEEAHPFELDLLKARAEDFREPGRSSSASGFGTMEGLKRMGDLHMLLNENPGMDQAGLLAEIKRRIEASGTELEGLGYNPSDQLGLRSDEMEALIQKRGGLEELQRLLSNPQVSEQLFQGGGGQGSGQMPPPQQQGQGQSPFFDSLMQGSQGGQAPGQGGGQANALQDRLPGQMPTEDISGFLANMPQGPGTTEKDQSYLGEFGQLWQTVMNPSTPEEQLIAAWSRLADYRVQPPMWVGLRLQGQGGPGPA